MSSTNKRPRRALTEGESFVLQHIQDMYGNQNTEQNVFFSVRDEAVIFVKNRNGNEGLLAVLTNLAAMFADGTVTSEEELRPVVAEYQHRPISPRTASRQGDRHRQHRAVSGQVGIYPLHSRRRVLADISPYR